MTLEGRVRDVTPVPPPFTVTDYQSIQFPVVCARGDPRIRLVPQSKVQVWRGWGMEGTVISERPVPLSCRTPLNLDMVPDLRLIRRVGV